MVTHDIVVIGAGLCGLLAARELQRHGHRVLVLEKSRGVGGRMATKRLGAAQLDQGAQYFTARDLRFAGMVEEWESLGLVRTWPGSESEAGEARWVGVPSMTSVAKHLANGLDVQREARVQALARTTEGWLLLLEGGGSLAARQVIATAPVPQVLEWLAAGGTLPDEEKLALLRGVVYEPCLTALAVLDGPSAVPEPGWLAFRPGAHPVFSWIADNGRKGVSQVPAVTLQANGPWSAEKYGAEPAEAIRLLLEAAQPWLGAKVLETALHRWRYSRVTAPAPVPYWSHPAGGLVLAGDGFGGARVEGAAVSAFAVVGYLHGGTVL